jgi:hydroxymethylglutaryl-CoA lyase
MEMVKIIEGPRDAWQGLPGTIPTAEKAEYLAGLMRAGFRSIDAVSFVSPRHVPQMADSEAVLASLRNTASLELAGTEIIAIVVNETGLERALAAAGVRTVGCPYSVSAQFTRANANMSVEESRALVERLRQATQSAGRNLVIYISMAFGNPYGEPWSPELVAATLLWLKKMGVSTVSLADTVGAAGPEDVGRLLESVRGIADGMELGVHLHSRPDSAAEKVLAAYQAGCRRFDGVLTGLGGCPFASDHLVGNIPTEIVVEALAARGVETGIQPAALASALQATRAIRAKYAG